MFVSWYKQFHLLWYQLIGGVIVSRVWIGLISGVHGYALLASIVCIGGCLASFCSAANIRCWCFLDKLIDAYKYCSKAWQTLLMSITRAARLSFYPSACKHTLVRQKHLYPFALDHCILRYSWGTWHTSGFSRGFPPKPSPSLLVFDRLLFLVFPCVVVCRRLSVWFRLLVQSILLVIAMFW